MTQIGIHIRYGGPVFDERDKRHMSEAVQSIMESGWLSMGPYTEAFESRLAETVGAKHALLVNSGSSANLLIIAGLVQSGRLTPGDEVITTAVNFPTSVNPLLVHGLTVRFVDVTPEYTIEIDEIERLISPHTKAVLATHIGGLPPSMVRLAELCRLRDLILLEDACDALGGKEAGKYLGTWGLAGSYSFYPSHQITTGEGGAVVTDDEDLALVMKSIRAWGRAAAERPVMGQRPRIVTEAATLPGDWERLFTFTHVGFNLKATEFQAALGLTQLEKLDAFAERRRATYAFLYDAVKDIAAFDLAEPNPHSAPFWFPIIVREDSPFERHDIVSYLEEHSIETRLMLGGDLRRQPAYAGRFGSETVLPQTDRVLRRSLIVGVYPGITDSERQYVARHLRESAQGRH